jgi:rsbT antagonist protein RsbS
VSIPILKLGDHLVATIQSAASDEELRGLESNLPERAGQLRSKGVVIDVGAMDVLDSYATRMLRTTADILRLRGAETVVVGIQPDVAFAMVRMGLNLEGLQTALDLEEGIALLLELEARGEE